MPIAMTSPRRTGAQIGSSVRQKAYVASANRTRKVPRCNRLRSTPLYTLTQLAIAARIRQWLRSGSVHSPTMGLLLVLLAREIRRGAIREVEKGEEERLQLGGIADPFEAIVLDPVREPV